MGFVFFAPVNGAFSNRPTENLLHNRTRVLNEGSYRHRTGPGRNPDILLPRPIGTKADRDGGLHGYAHFHFSAIIRLMHCRIPEPSLGHGCTTMPPKKHPALRGQPWSIGREYAPIVTFITPGFHRSVCRISLEPRRCRKASWSCGTKAAGSAPTRSRTRN